MKLFSFTLWFNSFSTVTGQSFYYQKHGPYLWSLAMAKLPLKPMGVVAKQTLVNNIHFYKVWNMKQSELLFAYYVLPLVPRKARPQIGHRIMASFRYIIQKEEQAWRIYGFCSKCQDLYCVSCTTSVHRYHLTDWIIHSLMELLWKT